MATRGEKHRFWWPVVGLGLLALHSTQGIVRAHVDSQVKAPDYAFTRLLPAPRGAIYSSYGKSYPFARSVPYWRYSLDPVSLTNGFVRPKGEKRPRTKEAIVRTISDALGLEYQKVLAMANSGPKSQYRDQFLALSSDPDAHRTIADSSLVRGVAIHDLQVRKYLHTRHLAHVLGSVNADFVGSAGIEQKFNRELTGSPGTIQGKVDARGRELYDKRVVSIAPVPGSDIYLTIDHNIQYETEEALKWGLREFGAATGWCIVMKAKTGAILAMASLPDFNPVEFGRASDAAKLNRAIGFNYEPGSVMKVITAAAAFDAGFVGPETLYSTDRFDSRYYKLPGDTGHVWPARMSVSDAIVHSSNIVIGKLAYDFGAMRLYKYMKKFGFGAKTGIDLPGEEVGILPNPEKRMWDKASQSRAGIGQFVAVSAIQIVSAYQAIANDGLRLKPHVVDRIVRADGTETYHAVPTPLGRPISAQAARTMRKVMLGVASSQGTARRAAITGYSVAGKTGTAQKAIPGGKGYYPGQFRGSFCGIVPASDPELVILVTLDFDRKNYPYHQGGRSSGPVFKRIATAALRYLMIQPDRPDEISEFDSDELSDLMESRGRKHGDALR